MHACLRPAHKANQPAEGSTGTARAAPPLQRAARAGGDAALPGAPRETITDYAGARAASAGRVAGTSSRLGLPESLRNGLETLSGMALDDVRVHRNSASPGRIGAHAYARGNDIHLAPGQDRHLPHEAWHVVQQRSGRVRPTMQLGGTSINDDGGLEAEADRMGSRAASMPAMANHAAAAPPPPPPRNAPLQAVWIIRAGQYVWENDPYVLQPGESYPFASRPRVLVEQGTKEIQFDSSGTQSLVTRKPPPTHEKLQEDREAQGKAMRARLLADPTKIKGLTKELTDLSAKLEALAGRSAPLKNAQKAQNMIKGGTILGEKFRTMVKAKDEFTQSEATAAHLRGLRTDDKSAHSADVEGYATALLRLMSSLRTPTQTVLAPVTHNSKVIGQQHPTSRDQPVLEDGASGHSFADRDRVQEQVDVFRQAIGNSSAGPNQIELATMLSALSKTLASMSAPTSATNLPRFHQSREEQQVKEREVVKQQLNLIAQTLNIPIETGRQDFDEVWRETERPTSPARNESTAPRIKKPKLAPSPLTTPSTGQTGTQAPVPQSTTPPQPVLTSPPQTLATSPDSDVISQAVISQLFMGIGLQQDATGVALQLLNLLRDQNDGYDGHRAMFGNDVALAYQAAMNIDLFDPGSPHALQQLLGILNNTYRAAAPLLRRDLAGHGAHEDPHGATGQRLQALAQVFAECGQMAAHNALAIVGHPDVTAQNVGANVTNQNTLNGLGNFHNNIDEDDIRAILAQAGRTDIPVIGGIENVGAVIDHLHQHDLEWFAANDIGQGEVTTLAPLLSFMREEHNSLTLVLNTQGHQAVALHELHWITVRVTRNDAGQLAVQYLDSLNVPADYTDLFDALRQLLGRAPRDAEAEPEPDFDFGLPPDPFDPFDGSGPSDPSSFSFGSSSGFSTGGLSSSNPFSPPGHGTSNSGGWGHSTSSFPSPGNWVSAPLESLFPELDYLDNRGAPPRKKARKDPPLG